ncbi:hypothetical protein A4H97_11255 [Niastella yeongjuensis]|uniref:Uncharacterized protein n=1 Tax=Niastella yeongjuensis TaxID=354355 RepID=A0A1V9E9F5_9BACT|nr:hypothetical protein [Niastella yeongjuensis]OQP42736.1 hypothetical protein A4H97_11255 [Niastella yeongjuensis]SEO51894.1 hypothetical protein SAMN05660816_02918 [Niastella yeongjuensis]
MKRFCFGLLLLLCFSVAKAAGPEADSSNKKAYTGDLATDQGFADSAAIKSMAISAVEKVEQAEKWLEMLQPDDLNELPVGLRRTINNITYKVAISSAVFHETYAELTVFAKVTIPQRDEPLFFGISSLKLSYRGGIVGDAKLVLLGDCNIPIHGGNANLILKGGFNLQNGQAQGDLTYLTIDCNGFKELGVTAQVEFPRSLLIPCDNSGSKITDPKAKVSGAFKTVITDWNDILLTVSLPKFQVNKLDGFVFTVTNAVFDFSDTRNSPDVKFPSGYEAQYLHYPNPFMWRGVYIQTIEIELPKMFRRGGSTGPVSFGGKDMIIDNNGVSGLFTGKDILRYNTGSASGWHFSVDDVSIGLEANHLVSASFSGNLGLPVADKDSLLYEAVITEDNKYWLTVKPKKQLDFQLWQARVDLDSNSYIKLLVEDGNFRPEANLNGRMSIAASNGSGSSIAELKAITFRNMHLKTVSPYFTVDYFGYDGEIKVAKFPVSIDSIVLVANATRADLSFGVKLTLSENAFKASTRLNIGCTYNQQNGFSNWKFDKVTLSKIKIDNAKIGGLTLNGEIDFMQDDPTYGDGFSGGITANFDALNKVEVKVRCMFGYNKFRYWFVDGSAKWAEGFPVGGALKINGFTGGAYYRMSKVNAASGTTLENLPNYKPDSALGLGIKAGVFFNVVKSEVIQGMAEFEVAFNRGGGMNYIGFFGNAKFMGKLPGIASKFMEKSADLFNKVENAVSKQLEGLSDAAKLDKIEELQKLKITNPQQAGREIPPDEDMEMANGISAYMGMFYDFQSNTFHANFDIYVNAAKGLLQGIGDNYRAGWAVMHFDPKDWYVYMGTPTDPIGIQFGLGGFKIKTQSYFMLGTNIPGSPPPPREVADILGMDIDQLDYMRDANALGEGRGIAFGSRVTVETGDITFLILYANFKAGLGFDMMLKDYGDAHCEGSSDPIGMDGWYANAQAYAYLQGELGVKVNLWFLKARIPIIQGAAAALVQAKLPNPAWFAGYLGVRFNLLGGLVKGNVRFKVEIGNDCKIVAGGGETTPVGIAVISDVTPKDAAEVDVFAAPQAAFNFAIGKDIPVSDDKGDHTYRIQLDQFDLSANGNTITGKLKWNANNDAVTFYSNDILPPSTSVTANVKVSFKENQNGAWQTVYIDGKKAEEARTLTFTTGKAPESIPLSNISYAWPVVEQQNFYAAETNQGVVQLKRGQPYLFSIPGYIPQLMVRSTNGGAAVKLPFTYDSNECRLRFNIFKIQNNAAYELVLQSVPSASSAGSAGGFVTNSTTTDAGDSVQITGNSATDVVRADTGKTLLNYTFHSSRYGTFAEKMQVMQLGNSTVKKLSSDLFTLQQAVSGAEPLDLCELTGTDYTNNVPLVQPLALTDNDFFRSYIYPLNYKTYPVAGDIVFNDRDTTELGFVPVRSLPVILAYQSLVSQGNFTDRLVTNYLPYLYDLPRIYKQDFLDLQAQVVSRYLSTPQQKDYEWLINGFYPMMTPGYYKVNYQFVLPGGINGSSHIVQYYNPIQ